MEDVILWRALKDSTDSGFYVDLGAFDPTKDSVTKAFYEKGWRGINVEPNPNFFARISAHRPRDVNLCEAVTDHLGFAEMNFLSNPGLSTLDDEIAAKHGEHGLGIRREFVSLTTLARIWSEHIPLEQDVHFLKIDIEGAEGAALRGNNWALARPWIVVIESTFPMTQVDSFRDWEPILLEANYLFAYADGLNRFYLAQERSELLSRLRHPPNVFDDFILFRQAQAAQAAEQKAQAAEQKAQAAEQKAQAAEERLFRMEQTSSWKLTAPLRLVRRKLKGLSAGKILKHIFPVGSFFSRRYGKKTTFRRPEEPNFSAQGLRFNHLLRQAMKNNRGGPRL